jgi:uncharacterized protein YjbJ (UPF0337 family)
VITFALFLGASWVRQRISASTVYRLTFRPIDGTAQRRYAAPWLHRKGGLYHDGRFATLRGAVEHSDFFKRLGVAERRKKTLSNSWNRYGGRLSKEKRRKPMKPSTKDQVEGKLHEIKGKVKEKAGQVTNDPNLEAEGQSEKLAGKIQKKVGQIEKVFEK